jgi:hypothetical protein
LNEDTGHVASEEMLIFGLLIRNLNELSKDLFKARYVLSLIML